MDDNRTTINYHAEGGKLNMSVLKKEFIDRMAETGGITKKEARRGVDLFFETLADYMSEDRKVVFTGIGKFEMKTFKERTGRIPIGGAECFVPAHRKMKFRASERLVEKIEERGK